MSHFSLETYDSEAELPSYVVGIGHLLTDDIFKWVSDRDSGLRHKIKQRNFPYPLTYRIGPTSSCNKYFTSLRTTNGPDGWSIRS